MPAVRSGSVSVPARYGEGAIGNQVRLLLSGASPYHAGTGPPPIVGNYPPVHPAAAALLHLLLAPASHLRPRTRARTLRRGGAGRGRRAARGGCGGGGRRCRDLGTPGYGLHIWPTPAGALGGSDPAQAALTARPRRRSGPILSENMTDLVLADPPCCSSRS